jgi:hypothetical protein
MNSVGGLTCFIFALVLIGITYLFRTNQKKDHNIPTEAVRKPPRQFWKKWTTHFIIAFILLVFWTVVVALFYLAVAWVLMQDPDPDSHFKVEQREKSTARRVYTWLFLSSLFTVPIFLVLVINNYSQTTSNNEYVLFALAPLLLHLFLLMGLTSDSIFVYRHTQQGILLIAVRAAVAALAVGMGDHPDDGIWLFLFGNGSLWLFGSIWGWVQVRRGIYSWKKQSDGMSHFKAGPIKQIETGPHPNLSPERSIEYSRWYLREQRPDTAKEYALEAFRHGNVDIRQKAVRILDDLDQVEFF